MKKGFYAPTVAGTYRSEHITEAERQRRLRKIKADRLKGKHIGMNSDTVIQISLVRMPRPTGEVYRDESPITNTENNNGPVLTKKL